MEAAFRQDSAARVVELLVQLIEDVAINELETIFPTLVRGICDGTNFWSIMEIFENQVSPISLSLAFIRKSQKQNLMILTKIYGSVLQARDFAVLQFFFMPEGPLHRAVERLMNQFTQTRFAFPVRLLPVSLNRTFSIDCYKLTILLFLASFPGAPGNWQIAWLPF